MYKLVQRVISIRFSQRHIHIDTFDFWAMTERQKVMQVVISICKDRSPLFRGLCYTQLSCCTCHIQNLNIRKRLSSQTFPMSSPQSVAKSVPQKWQVPSSCKKSAVQERFNKSSSAVLLFQFVKPGVRNLVDINLRGKILPLVAAGPQHLNHDSF